jgi:hypothetical protein
LVLVLLLPPSETHEQDLGVVARDLVDVVGSVADGDAGCAAVRGLAVFGRAKRGLRERER